MNKGTVLGAVRGECFTDFHQGHVQGRKNPLPQRVPLSSRILTSAQDTQTTRIIIWSSVHANRTMLTLSIVCIVDSMGSFSFFFIVVILYDGHFQTTHHEI